MTKQDPCPQCKEMTCCLCPVYYEREGYTPEEAEQRILLIKENLD